MNSKDNKVFNFTLAFYPLFSCYATAIRGLSIGDLLIILSVLYSLFTSKKAVLRREQSFSGWLLGFYLYCIIVICVIFFAGTVNIAETNVINRFLKYSVFIFVILLMPNYLDRELFDKYFRCLVLIAAYGLFIQYIFHYILHTDILLKIPFLNYINNLDSTTVNRQIGNTYRPSSIFFEPAAYSCTIIVYIVCLLDKKYKSFEKKALLELGLIIISVIMTLSSTSIILLTITFACHIIRVILDGNFKFSSKIRYLMLLLVVLLVGIAFYINSETLYNSFSRMSYTVDSNTATTVWSRLSNGSTIAMSLSGVYRYFGVGLGNIDEIANSYYYLLYCTGYCGVIIHLLWAISVFKHTHFLGKTLIVIFTSLCFSSLIVMSGLLLLYNAYFIFDSSKDVYEEADCKLE